MKKISHYIKRWKEYRIIRHRKMLERRARDIFRIEEFDGSLWLFCNGTGIFPCSYVNLTSEQEIVKFLEGIRKLYIETE